jgi:branched-chain amino acid transport system substrate-binding protein
MSISRRDFLTATGAAAVVSGMRPLAAWAQGKDILLGSVLDNSGNLDIYGKPMVMATTMAVEELNAAGGLLGRKIKAVQYDTQSDIALYTKFAQQLARQDKVDVVHGGITSASREAIRQTFKRANTLYFYNVLYEGGVCDRNCVVTGTTPAQAVEPIVELATKKWGSKVVILAADYNYGQITAKWLQHYIGQRKGTVARIQQAAPNWVVSALVGGAHMAFYRQWAASGMNKKIPLASTTFGVGNEHLALSPAEGDGILIAGNYSQEAKTAANQDFLARWKKRFGDTRIVHEIAVSQYQGIMLWGACVKKAGALDRDAMLKTIESGVSIEGPAGTVTIEPKTHHTALDIHVMEVKGQKLTILNTVKQRAPSDTLQYCDLQKNPNENKQYEVKI